MPFSFDFGSVPDWVEAFGTSGALIYIAVQHHRDRQRDRTAVEAAERAQRDNEARQARLISVTLSWRFDHEGEPREQRWPGWLARLAVTNDSAEPIRNVRAILRPRRTLAEMADRFASPEDRTGDYAAVLRPREEIRMDVEPLFQAEEYLGDDEYGPDRPTPQRQLDSRYQAGVTFTDAAGLRWFQSNGGLPHREVA